MATAIGTYAVPASVKTRIGKSDNNDDAIITVFCNQVNGWMEQKMGRVVAPISSATYLFDGNDAVAGRRCLIVPMGVRAISLLEVAAYTSGAFSTIPSTDYFIRPATQDRQNGWPGNQIWMTDQPAAGNAYPFFPVGFANVRVTMTAGFAAIPDELTEAAEVMVVRMYQSRKTGQSDIAGTDDDGSILISQIANARTLRLLKDYADPYVSSY